MAIIVLPEWYQIDFNIIDQNAVRVKDLVLTINELIEQLTSLGLVDSWFFLYEGKTIRVRMRSKDKQQLEQQLKKIANKLELEMNEDIPFSVYSEGSEMMFNTSFINSFATIMSEITKLTIQKMKNSLEFDNYRALERLHHCMFNNLATLSLKKEEHFLQQRLLERIRRSFDDDFENI